MAYGKFGRGVEFFPEVEPDFAQVIVHARGNLSLAEKDGWSPRSKSACSAKTGIETVYTRVGSSRAA
jgi:multidrug efflux pump